jgi:hypothetical protein
MQEKSCKLPPKNLIFGGMKVAVNIRMPEEMKEALDKIASSQFRSLNSLILQLLDEALKAKSINWQEGGEAD